VRKYIIVLCVLVGGCSLKSCGLVASTDQTTQDVRGDKNKSLVNDPTSINILAWTLGGSVLVSGVASAYYHMKRSKENDK